MRALFFLLNLIICVLSSACDNHKCIFIYFSKENSEEPGICVEDSSEEKGYKCQCEELNATNHLSFDDCYIFDGDGDSIVLDTEPTTTTLTAEPSTTFLDTMVSPSLLPPEEITDEETSTTTSRPSIAAAKPDRETTTIKTTTKEDEKEELIFGMPPMLFFILIGCCGAFVIIIVVVSIIYCRCPSKKMETPARNGTERNILLPDIDEEENFPTTSSNRAETNWRDSQDSFENSENDWVDQTSPTEAIKLCKYVTQNSASQSQNGGSRPISCSMHSISSTRPSVKPPAPPVPDPSALLNAPPDFPPPPPPPAPESSGNMIANPKYPYHVPLATQQQH